MLDGLPDADPRARRTAILPHRPQPPHFQDSRSRFYREKLKPREARSDTGRPAGPVPPPGPRCGHPAKVRVGQGSVLPAGGAGSGRRPLMMAGLDPGHRFLAFACPSPHLPVPPSLSAVSLGGDSQVYLASLISPTVSRVRLLLYALSSRAPHPGLAGGAGPRAGTSGGARRARAGAHGQVSGSVSAEPRPAAGVRCPRVLIGRRGAGPGERGLERGTGRQGGQVEDRSPKGCRAWDGVGGAPGP